MAVPGPGTTAFIDHRPVRATVLSRFQTPSEKKPPSGTPSPSSSRSRLPFAKSSLFPPLTSDT